MNHVPGRDHGAGGFDDAEYRSPPGDDQLFRDVHVGFVAEDRCGNEQRFVWIERRQLDPQRARDGSQRGGQAGFCRAYAEQSSRGICGKRCSEDVERRRVDRRKPVDVDPRDAAISSLQSPERHLEGMDRGFAPGWCSAGNRFERLGDARLRLFQQIPRRLQRSPCLQERETKTSKRLEASRYRADLQESRGADLVAQGKHRAARADAERTLEVEDLRL